MTNGALPLDTISTKLYNGGMDKRHNMNTRAKKYHNDYFKSKRLHKIAKRWGRNTQQGYFVKGKLHCSCPMCATKTKSSGWSVSDRKKPQFYRE